MKDQFSRRVPWRYMPHEQVVRHRTGYYQRTLCYRGHDLSSKSLSELNATINRINEAVMRLGAGWVIHAESQRTPIQPVEAVEMSNDFGALIEATRRRNLNDAGRLYSTRHYLTLTYVPQNKVTMALFERFTRLFGGLFTGGVDHQEQQDEEYRELMSFLEKSDRFHDQIKSLFPYLEFLEGEALLTYLHSTISANPHRVRVPNPASGLNHLLADSPVDVGREMMLGHKHVRVISVLGYPPVTAPSNLFIFDQLPMSYRMVTRFMQLGRREALNALKEHKKFVLDQRVRPGRKGGMSHQQETNDVMVRHNASIKRLIERVEEGEVSVGFHQVCFVIADEDPVVCAKNAKRITSIFDDKGFITIDETDNLSSAWLGAMPGNVYSNPRRPLLTSKNFAHTMSIQSSWEGDPISTHLGQAPHAVTITNNCVPFYLNLNLGNVGHTMILGTTGGGKSMLMCALMALFLKYKNARIYHFDKDRSSRATILGAGGQFIDMAVGQAQMAFQPLKDIDQIDELEFVSSWLEEVLVQQGVEMGVERNHKLARALKNVAHFPPHQRTLTSLRLQVQDKAIQAGLAPFCKGGLYGSVWDNDSEALSLSDIVAFEMGKLMDSDDRLIAMTLRYLFQRIEQRIKTQHVEGHRVPTFLGLDEAWRFFQHPMFAKRIAEWLVTMRKFDVYVVFASQQIKHVTQSNIAATLLDSCHTRILLPTYKASTPEFKPAYEALGLNETQIDHLVRVANQQNANHWRYYFTNPKGDRFFEFKFSPLEKAFFGASSPKDQAAIDRAIKDAKAHNLPFGQVYLHQKGFVSQAQQWGQFR